MLSIIVRDIVDKKIVDKRIYLSIYIVDANKVILETRFYVTKDIKTDVILDNNVLELPHNKINLYLHNKQIQIDRIQISIKFTSSKILSISFHVISITVYISLKLYLKTSSKQTFKTMKFAIKIGQRKHVNTTKIDASFQCSFATFIAFIACEINDYWMLRFAESVAKKICFRLISKISLENVSKTSK